MRPKPAAFLVLPLQATRVLGCADVAAGPPCALARVPRVVTRHALLETYLQHRPLSLGKADVGTAGPRTGAQASADGPSPSGERRFPGGQGPPFWPHSSCRSTRNISSSSFEKLCPLKTRAC